MLKNIMMAEVAASMVATSRASSLMLIEIIELVCHHAQAESGYQELAADIARKLSLIQTQMVDTAAAMAKLRAKASIIDNALRKLGIAEEFASSISWEQFMTDLNVVICFLVVEKNDYIMFLSELNKHLPVEYKLGQVDLPPNFYPSKLTM